MSREQFDAAIGTAPASTVDIEAVLDRERRRARVRRVANPWTAAAAGVAAVAVAVAFLPSGSGGTAVVPGAAATPSAPAPSDDPCAADPFPPQTGAPIPEKADVAASRLTGVLTAAVQQRVATGTKLQPHADGEYPKGKQHGPLTFFHVFSARVPYQGACAGGEDYFSAAAATVHGSLKGNVWVVVTRLGGNATPSAECGKPPVDVQLSCRRQTGPHGENIIEQTYGFRGGVTLSQVDITKPDGTGVIIGAENVAGSAKKATEPDMPSPPLSLAQLREVALDPGVTLYP